MAAVVRVADSVLRVPLKMSGRCHKLYLPNWWRMPSRGTGYWVSGRWMELVNVPIPVPSLVQVPPTAGLADVLQQTPLCRYLCSPVRSDAAPPVADVLVILEMAVVTTVGRISTRDLRNKVRLLSYFRDPLLQPIPCWET